MKDNKVWFVLELETGLIDGWYTKNAINIKKDIIEVWHNRRPNYTHVIAETNIPVPQLPDNRYLNWHI